MGSLSPPDPMAAIGSAKVNAAGITSDQTAANLQAGSASQRASMVDQANPYGSVNYTQTGTGPGGVPIYSAKTSLSPEQQQLFNRYMATKGTAGQGAGALLSGANYGSQQPGDVIGSATSGNTKALMDKQVAYLQPQFDYEKTKLDTQLRNQGINPGEPAYDQQMAAMQRTHDQTLGSIAANFEGQAYQQAQQNYTLPETMAMQMAQFGAHTSPTGDLIQTPQANFQAPDYTGAAAVANKQSQDLYNNQYKNYSNLMSGLFGMATPLAGGAGQALGAGGMMSLLALSDEALKDNIVEVGRTPDDIPIKLFSYKGDSDLRLGVMAQDVEKVKPGAVYKTNSGYKAVDYVHALLG